MPRRRWPAASARIELILAELHMPRVGGIELARMVSDEPVHRHIPIILITGKFDTDGAVHAYRAGAETSSPSHSISKC